MIEEATIPKACQQLAKSHFRQHYRRATAPASSKGIENINQPACFLSWHRGSLSQSRYNIRDR